jgi:hypothetical protein
MRKDFQSGKVRNKEEAAKKGGGGEEKKAAVEIYLGNLWRESMWFTLLCICCLVWF